MLAAMHGSTFVGDGAAALRAGADMMEREFGCYDRVDAQQSTVAGSR
jgi:hypothetical protein